MNKTFDNALLKYEKYLNNFTKKIPDYFINAVLIYEEPYLHNNNPSCYKFRLHKYIEIEIKHPEKIICCTCIGHIINHYSNTVRIDTLDKIPLITSDKHEINVNIPYVFDGDGNEIRCEETIPYCVHKRDGKFYVCIVNEIQLYYTLKNVKYKNSKNKIYGIYVRENNYSALWYKMYC